MWEEKRFHFPVFCFPSTSLLSSAFLIVIKTMWGWNVLRNGMALISCIVDAVIFPSFDLVRRSQNLHMRNSAEKLLRKQLIMQHLIQQSSPKLNLPQKAHNYLQFFTIAQKEQNISQQHVIAIVPIIAFAGFSHCGICLGIHLMIIMWKDQLITHRASDLNEWNAENIESKIQLCAMLKRARRSRRRSERKEKTISFVAEWIHLFLRLPSFSCYSFLLPLCSIGNVSFIYENAKLSFVRAIIRRCAVNYNLKLRGKLKPTENFSPVAPRLIHNSSHLSPALPSEQQFCGPPPPKSITLFTARRNFNGFLMSCSRWKLTTRTSNNFNVYYHDNCLIVNNPKN